MTSPNTRTRLIWRNGKKVRAHRWLMEQHLGRALLSTEHVHHRDGNPLNNDLANLEVLDGSEHMRMHKSIEPTARACGSCGVVFVPVGRKRHQYKTCSPRCAQAMRVEAMLKGRRAA